MFFNAPEGQKIVLPPLQMPPYPVRDMWDSGYDVSKDLPRMHIVPTLAQKYSSRPAIPANAPSLSTRNPFNAIRTHRKITGHVTYEREPCTRSDECSECFIDGIIESQRLATRPSFPPNDNRAHFRGPKPGDQVVIMFRHVGRRGDPRAPFVSVESIVNFASPPMEGAADKVLQTAVPGAMRVKLHIKRYGSIDDYIYGNCVHRAATVWTLACQLAWAFKIFAEDVHNLHASRVQLVSLTSPDGVEFTATARVV
ncbi:hypothetical protein R3P38DRAFT_618190 [Favolaschia claudopus]|uniref:Uncharacterized protein n=1 Tax=Favolaschia claudopus TaxID=2862362 RepID=A0AAW0CBG1_9AGAR